MAAAHRFLLLALCTLGALAPFSPALAAPLKVAEKTAGLAPRDGLLRFVPDPATGTVWLRLPPPGERGVSATLLYTESIRTGLGSNDIGLDRGQLGEPRVVEFRRLGKRVLVEEVNLRYRAGSPDARERATVRESFATSVLWAGEVAAADPDGTHLVDFTSFLVRDAHGTAARLDEAEQGTYELDADRSAVDFTECHAFPDNLEFEALLTFAGKAKGDWIRSVAPHPDAVSLVQHHSFVRLPDDGYTPRAHHVRSGFFSIAYQDYAAPIASSLTRRLLVRHRLEKIDPTAERSRVRKPIVYYVDAGAPEPIRSALVEGASWWARAFDEAGFVDGFRVELLPPGAHPLDVRYNVIQWVHRATRGWSYGGSVYDPRTGEVLKGHVTLGSLRVRQDRLLFEGLAGTARTGSGADDDPIQLSLARIRQLAAHEVGHALGLAHNFAASTYGDRASVMDYPAPLIDIGTGDELDFGRAYGVGIGSWDRHAVHYGYSQFPPGADEARELARIVREGDERGFLFASDSDARPAGASLAAASLWDNGDDAVRDLEQALRVREIALARFGRGNLPSGEPLAHLQEVLAPVYFHHRYALEAALKLVGGYEYEHALAGEAFHAARPVSADRQQAALGAVLSALEPRRLDLPDTVWALLLPRPPEEGENRELFASRTEPAFDLLSAAEAAQGEVLAGVLQPERMARLVDLHRRDPALPSLEDALARLADAVFESRGLTSRQREIRRAGEAALVSRWSELAADPDLPHAVRYRIEEALVRLAARLRGGGGESAEEAHRAVLREALRRHGERAAPPAEPAGEGPAPPPGPPIGSGWPSLGGCDRDGG